MRLSGILLQPIHHRAHSLFELFCCYAFCFIVPSLIVTRGFADCQYGSLPKCWHPCKKSPTHLSLGLSEWDFILITYANHSFTLEEKLLSISCEPY
jgi:hypothetical protein